LVKVVRESHMQISRASEFTPTETTSQDFLRTTLRAVWTLLVVRWENLRDIPGPALQAEVQSPLSSCFTHFTQKNLGWISLITAQPP